MRISYFREYENRARRGAVAVRPAARPGPVVELEDEGVALAVVGGVVRAAAGGAWPWALGVFSRAPLYSCAPVYFIGCFPLKKDVKMT